VEKKILMLLNAPYPPDIRVKKEVDALIGAGFEISLICHAKENFPEEEKQKSLTIYRIHAGGNKYILTFWDILLALKMPHFAFLRKAKELINKENFIAIHVHDLPLCLTALKVKKYKPIAVVGDFHENYPDAITNWLARAKNPILKLKNKLFMGYSRWFAIEKEVCRKADVIIAVVDEMKVRLSVNHGIDLNKIAVVTNSEEKNFRNQALDTTVYGEWTNRFKLTYTGGIDSDRGLETAIRGMALLRDYPEIEFFIIGGGKTSYIEELKSISRELHTKNTHFLGYKPFDKIFSYMNFADVNVIPHRMNNHTDNTVPHKLFQGMMTQKPVLVSSCKPLKRVIENTHAGLVFEADNPEDFAEQVLKFYHNRDLIQTLGMNGYKATVEGDLNWDYDKQNLINIYRKF
jgi:glycosyltransferase involved in cell wall biosynthesis